MDVLTRTGEVKSQIDLPDFLFGQKVVGSILWESVRCRLANQRSGTACTKTRGEVSGTGKKPWRQKHTGRARHGSRRSPIWRGGGIAFGPKPRDYSYRLPKKEKSKALAAALSARNAENAIRIVEDFTLSAPKTRELVDVLKRLNLTGAVLLLVDKAPRELLLAGRNLPGLTILPAEQVGAYDVLRHDTILFTEGGFTRLISKVGAA